MVCDGCGKHCCPGDVLGPVPSDELGGKEEEEKQG